MYSHQLYERFEGSVQEWGIQEPLIPIALSVIGMAGASGWVSLTKSCHHSLCTSWYRDVGKYRAKILFFVYVHCYSAMGVKYPGTGITESCELPCGCWELNPGLLEEQSVLLTPEPSLQPTRKCFFSALPIILLFILLP